MRAIARLAVSSQALLGCTAVWADDDLWARSTLLDVPGGPKRHYRLRTRRLADPHLALEDWLGAAEQRAGSWWPAWQQWLAAHSSGKTKAPAMGAASKVYRVVEDAPGQYVRQR